LSAIGFFFAFHDVGQAGITRLVQPQIRGDDGRPLQFHGLQPAIDFTGHLEIGTVDLKLGGKGRLRPSEQGRQHLAGLVAIIVDRLLPRITRPGFSSSAMAFSNFATASGSTLPSALTKMPRSAPMASPVRMVSAACAGPIDTTTTSVALPASFRRNASSTAIFVERIHRHLDIGQFDARSVAFDADLDVEIDHPLYRTRTFIDPLLREF